MQDRNIDIYDRWREEHEGEVISILENPIVSELDETQKIEIENIQGQTITNLVGEDGKDVFELKEIFSDTVIDGKKEILNPTASNVEILEIQGETYQNLMDGQKEEVVKDLYVWDVLQGNGSKDTTDNTIGVDEIHGQTYQNLIDNGDKDTILVDARDIELLNGNSVIENTVDGGELELVEIWGNTWQDDTDSKNLINNNEGYILKKWTADHRNHIVSIIEKEKMKVGTSYTISMPTALGADYRANVVGFKNEVPTVITQIFMNNVGTFSLNSEYDEYAFTCYSTVDITTSYNLNKVQLEKGTVATDYVPYHKADLSNIQHLGKLHVDNAGNPILDSLGREQYKVEVETDGYSRTKSTFSNYISKVSLNDSQFKTMNFGHGLPTEVYLNIIASIDFEKARSGYFVTFTQGGSMGVLFNANTKTLTFKKSDNESYVLGEIESNETFVITVRVYDNKKITAHFNGVQIFESQFDNMPFTSQGAFSFNSKYFTGYEYGCSGISLYLAQAQKNAVNITNIVSNDWNSMNVKYFKQTILLPCQLMKVGDIADRLWWDSVKGKYVVEKNVNDVVITRFSKVGDNRYCMPECDNTIKIFGDKSKVIMSDDDALIKNIDTNGHNSYIYLTLDLEKGILLGLDSESAIINYLITKKIRIVYGHNKPSQLIETNITKQLLIPTYADKTHIIIGNNVLPSKTNLSTILTKYNPIIGLLPNAEYTIIADTDRSTATSDISYDLGGATGTIPTTSGYKYTTQIVRTPATLTHNELKLSGLNNKVKNVMLLNGKGQEVLSYFEGIESVGERVSNIFDKSAYYDLYTNYDEIVDSYRTKYIYLKPNTTYNIYAKIDSYTSSSAILLLENNTTRNIYEMLVDFRRQNSEKRITFTTNELGKLRIRNYSGGVGTVLDASIVQITEGEQEYPYMEYGQDKYKIEVLSSNNEQSQSKQFLLSEPLRKIGDVSDRIFYDYDKGKYCVERNIDKTIVSDFHTRLWKYKSPSTSNTVGFFYCEYPIIVDKMGISRKAETICDIMQTINSYYIEYFNEKNEGIGWENFYTNKYVFIRDTKNFSQDDIGARDLTNWLNGKVFTFYHPTTSSPIIEELPYTDQMINTYAPKTYISTNLNIKPSLTRLESRGKESKNILTPSTKYTVQFDVDKNSSSRNELVLNLGGTVNTSIVPINGAYKTHKLTLTTPSTLGNGGKFSIGGEGFKVKNVMLFEGEKTQIPNYFNDIVSVGEYDSVNNKYKIDISSSPKESEIITGNMITLDNMNGTENESISVIDVLGNTWQDDTDSKNLFGGEFIDINNYDEQNYSRLNLKNFLNNGHYTIRINEKPSTVKRIWCNLYKNSVSVFGMLVTGNTTVGAKHTFEINDTDVYELGVYSEQITKQEALTEIFNNYNIQLEEGTVATEYVPYHKADLSNIQHLGKLHVDSEGNPILDSQGREQYEVVIESKNDNLLDINNFVRNTFDDRNNEYIVDTVITSPLIRYDSTKILTLGLTNDFVCNRYIILDKDMNVIKFMFPGNMSKVTVEPLSRGMYIKFGIRKSTSIPITPNDIKNTESYVYNQGHKDYIPHQSSKQTILLPCQLMKVGNVADRLYWDSVKGKYVVEKNVDIAIINGASGITSFAQSVNGSCFSRLSNVDYDRIFKEAVNKDKSICSAFNIVNTNSLANSHEIQPEAISMTGLDGHKLQLRLLNSRFTESSLNGQNIYLNNNPITIYYNLNTPQLIETEKTTKLSIPIYKDKTHILCSDGNLDASSMTIDVNYTFKQSIMLDEPLRKVGGVADRLYWDDVKGKYVVEKNISRFVFVDDNISKFPANHLVGYETVVGFSGINIQEIISSDKHHKKYLMSDYFELSNWNANPVKKRYSFSVYKPSKGLSIRCREDLKDSLTVDIVRSDIRGVSVYFILETPQIIETDITTPIRLPMYADKTYIDVNGGIIKPSTTGIGNIIKEFIVSGLKADTGYSVLFTLDKDISSDTGLDVKLGGSTVSNVLDNGNGKHSINITTTNTTENTLKILSNGGNASEVMVFEELDRGVLLDYFVGEQTTGIYDEVENVYNYDIFTYQGERNIITSEFTTNINNTSRCRVLVNEIQGNTIDGVSVGRYRNNHCSTEVVVSGLLDKYSGDLLTGGTYDNYRTINTFMPILPNTEYTPTCYTDNGTLPIRAYIFDENNAIIQDTTGGTFTTLENARFIKLSIDFRNNLNLIDTAKYMLNEGATALPYEQYYEGYYIGINELYHIFLNEPLRSNDTVKDVLFVRCNELLVERNLTETLEEKTPTYEKVNLYMPLGGILLDLEANGSLNVTTNISPTVSLTVLENFDNKIIKSPIALSNNDRIYWDNEKGYYCIANGETIIELPQYNTKIALKVTKGV